MSTDSTVNPHYLGHVVALSETSDIEASEDILASNGMKLLGKGARIDARARERLLEHKLKKPLESMMRVADGVAARHLDRIAEALLARHPLLSRLCGPAGPKRLVGALRALPLPPQVDSLVAVYAGRVPQKLEHAVGTALTAAALAEAGRPAGGDVPALLLAGLAHDVGELYIDPALLQPGMRLTPQQWKHIVAHPVIGARVLKDMPGAGAAVARVVLCHHERLDGFGYPHGLGGSDLPPGARALGVAEMLMGLMEAEGTHPALHADVAMKLIPGEFDRALVDHVVTAARAVAREADTDALPEQDAAALLARMQALDHSLGHFHRLRPQIESALPRHGSALRELVDRALDRGERIRAALSSAGLQADGTAALECALQSADARTRAEAAIVLRELRWRLRELERLLTIRGEQLPDPDARQMERWLAMAKG